MKRVAIIGAGIGGAVLAGALAERHDLTLFEKGRGFGGRMSIREAGGFSFDHGAQYFTMRDPRFTALVEPLLETGKAAEWQGAEALFRAGKLVEITMPRGRRMVGVPGMGSFVAALAGRVEARFRTDVAMLAERYRGLWALSDVEGNALGTYDLVIGTATPRQTVGLFGARVPSCHPLRTQQMVPCYALMLGWQRPWDRDWVSARIEGGGLAFIGVNSTKPGRDTRKAALTVHTGPQFATRLLDLGTDEIARRIKAALLEETGIDASDAAHAVVHRWKSARLEHEAPGAPWYDPEQGIAATGDWAGRSRVEDVALSALDLAEMLQAG